jgi:hypothetical protein
VTPHGAEPPYPGAPDARRAREREEQARARQADALEAAREWREEMRERMPLPRDGETVTIRWPDGPHDFVMRFLYEDRKMCGTPPGWTFLHGQIVEPDSWHKRCWSFMVHLVDGEWTMLPKGGKLSDV